jgi:magnesium-transporting ATPase (P-type)
MRSPHTHLHKPRGQPTDPPSPTPNRNMHTQTHTTHTHTHTPNTQLEDLPPESWLSIFLGSFNDATLIVLIISAVVSLAIGIYEVSGCFGFFFSIFVVFFESWAFWRGV